MTLQNRSQRKKKAKKPLSISKLKKQATIVFNAWIRNRDGRCIRCGKTENLQCSHFWAAGRNTMRFNEENCDTLCYGCHYGNLAGWEYEKQGAYREWKIKQLGLERYQALERLSNVTKQWKAEELLAIITRYSLQKEPTVVEYTQ